MSWKQKKLEYQKRRTKRLSKQKKKKSHKSSTSSISGAGDRKAKRHFKEMPAPLNFSIYENHEETTEYLTQLYNIIRNGKGDIDIYFDFSEIKNVSIESIVYVIALIRNVRTKSKLKYNFRGNFPIDRDAQRMFQESGFLNFVRSNSGKLPKSSDHIQILTGIDTSTDKAKVVCDFAKSREVLSLGEEKILYRTMIELMSNTVQHAYKKETGGDFLSAWYLYCESNNGKLSFSFVDIGEGIPNTIYKKVGEKIFMDHSSAILSALKGEFRTETMSSYRGKGLPLLKEDVEKGFIKNFKVVSGKGSCRYDDERFEFHTNEYSNSIFGTVFFWEMGGKI